MPSESGLRINRVSQSCRKNERISAGICAAMLTGGSLFFERKEHLPGNLPPRPHLSSPFILTLCTAYRFARRLPSSTASRVILLSSGRWAPGIPSAGDLAARFTSRPLGCGRQFCFSLSAGMSRANAIWVEKTVQLPGSVSGAAVSGELPGNRSDASTPIARPPSTTARLIMAGMWITWKTISNILMPI